MKDKAHYELMRRIREAQDSALLLFANRLKRQHELFSDAHNGRAADEAVYRLLLVTDEIDKRIDKFFKED